MDDRQHAAALTDEALDGDLARALAVDPSPEFLARVRTRIASEPAPRTWSVLWAASLAGAVAAVVVAAVIANRPEQAPVAREPLAARGIVKASTLPSVASGFSRTFSARPSTSSGRAGLEIARGEPVEPRARELNLRPLLDPRETAALRSLIAGVRDNRVDLTPLLQPTAPAPMELPPVGDLVIAPIAIEPLTPQSGEGERQ